MKLAKKILAVLLAATLLASCFALFSSAQAPTITLDSLDDMLEYHTCNEVYVNEFYDEVEFDAGVAEVDYPNKQVTDISRYLFNKTYVAAKLALDPDNSSNKILAVKSLGKNYTGMTARYIANKTTAISESIVVSFDVKVEDDNAQGCYVQLSANNQMYFKLDLSNAETPAFSYFSYDPNGTLKYPVTRELAGMDPEFNKWYTITAVMNFSDNLLSVEVFERDNPQNKISTGNVKFNLDTKIIKDSKGNIGPTSVDITLFSTKKDSQTTVYFDNVEMYKGSFVRDTRTPQDTFNKYLVAVDGIANASSTSFDDKLKIADFYEKVFLNEELGILYDPQPDTANYEDVERIKSGAREYVNNKYAAILVSNMNKLASGAVGYYDRIDLCDLTTPYVDFLPDDRDELLALDGIDENGEDGNVKADDILAAKQTYENELAMRERVKQHSIRFVNLISGFDYDNDDYAYIKNFIDSLSDCDKCDGTFKYAEEVGVTEDDPKYKYQYAALAIEEYNAIKLAFAEMDANASTFASAVFAMKDEPQKTKGFGALYENYLKASSVFSNGTVHESLNIDTYPDVYGISMRECIDIYYLREAYVQQRVTECEEFIRLMSAAEASATYRKTLESLDAAVVYIDEDINNKSVETEYAGVNEAIAAYYALREKLADDVVNADAYKAAVNAIDISAPYTKLKASVADALALKEKGDVVGVVGVEEANIKLYEAEFKVKALEGNSETLVASVSSLKDAKTLAERRELIFIATNAAKGAEDSITGVKAAREALLEETAKFNQDVAAANAGFNTAVRNTLDVSSATAPSADVYKMADIIKALLK